MGVGPTRRQLLTAGSLAVTGTALSLTTPWLTAGAAGEVTGWAEADRIVRSTRRPRIPGRHVDITAHGALGDGVTDCTRAFASAIAALTRKGGGQVVVPPGRYLTGPIHLDNHIELHVQRDATIVFSTDPAAYLPVVHTRDGGIECMNYSPFIYAYGRHDIAITGEGTLDGQASNQHWWPWAGKADFGWQTGMPTAGPDGDLLASMADQGVPVQQRVFGAGHYVRPQFIQPYRCQNVLISGITIHNTPNWQMNPVLCTNVTVEHVTASSLGPNNDGCDPESCENVVIQNCTFETGDDCIAVKSGKNADGRRINQPCQNIVIQNCEFLAGHGMVTIGSEMSGGVRNLFARDCRADSLNLNDGLRLKTNSARGGFIEEVYLKNIKIEKLADAAVIVDFSYGEGAGYGFNPTVRGIHIDHLMVGTTVYPLYAIGYPDDHIGAITLRDSIVETASRSSAVRDCDDVTFDQFSVNGALATVPRPAPDLSAAFNNTATGTAGAPGNYDGSGRYFTADSLAAAGLTPGATLTHGGLTFAWPDAPPGSPDNVVAGAQLVTLAATGSTFAVLGAGAHGNQSGTFIVTYTDGTTSSGTVSVTDWWTAKGVVGDQLVATAKTNEGHPVGIYYATLPLTAGKTPILVEFPANANLHIFAIAVG